MLNLARPLRPEDYLAMAWRRKWWILIPFVLVSAAGIGIVMHLPKVYQANTLILLVRQRVPTEYVRATVTESIDERIYSISTEILSRTNLQRVIDEFGLYKAESQKLTQEEVIELMRKHIDIQVKGGTGAAKRDKKDAFEVYFSGPEPKTVAMVTNRLASLFVEQNLKLREQQAEGTAAFLADQLKKTEAQLEGLEKQITAFKTRHMGELPEQMQANLGVLQQLQLQHQRISDSIRSAEDRKVLYINQVAELRKFASTEGTGEPVIVEAPQSGRETLQDALARLRAKYTDRHPEVMALKKRLEEEGAQAGGPRASGASSPDRPARQIRTARGQTGQLDTMIAGLQAQLAAVDSEIRHLRGEEEKIRARIREHEQRIENTPRREQEMTALARDYENTKKSYESLLAKKLESEQAKAMEQRQQGEQFRVIDPAQVPVKPWKPDILKLIALSLACGLGAGLGLALLQEYLDRSFKDPEDLAAFSGLQVLAVIPRIETVGKAGGGRTRSSAATRRARSA